MSEALEKEFAAEAIPDSAGPDNQPKPVSVGKAPDLTTDVPPETPIAGNVSGVDRFTSNSKKFLSGFDTFEAQFRDSQADLKDISEKIANLAVSQHLTRDF